MLALQAFALVARTFRIGTETRRIFGAGAAKARRPRCPHAQPRRMRHKTEPMAHAERAVAAMRLLRTAGDGQGYCERENQTSAPNSVGRHDGKSMVGHR